MADHFPLKDSNSRYPLYSLPLELVIMAIPLETISIDIFLNGLDGSQQFQPSIFEHCVLFKGVVKEIGVVDEVATKEFDLLH